MKKYIKLLRVKHYLKNGLIFLPLFFSGNILNKSYLIITIIGFIVFSLASSVVYIINDINDVEKDKNHPVKCKRPIASGEISINKAKILAVLVFIIMTICHFSIVPTSNVNATLIIITYIILNFLYSIELKNIPIVDITILASGFLFRVMYGAFITGIEVSDWLYLTIITFSFYMGLGKRRNEMVKQSSEQIKETRKVLKYYTYEFLDKNMHMCLSIALVFYSLWTANGTDTLSLNKNYLIWTVPLIMIICMKYSLIIEGNSYGDPVDVLLSDKVLIGLVVVYIIILFLIVYGVRFFG